MNKKIISLATVIMIAIPYVSHAITERISIDSLGIQSDGASYNAAMSEDARYVFFSSYATNLVPNDTNRQQDIFMRDRISNTTTRISVSTSGDQGNGYSTINASQPVSTNGQFIIFNSQATNLVPNDTNSIQDDVFIRDTVNNITTRISVSTSGDQGNNHSYGKAITPDGRYVLFYSYATNLVPNDTNGQMDLFVRDTINNTTVLVTTDDIGNISNGYSSPISITPDGRYVLFQSDADNLVANDTNFSSDGFVRDLVSNTTTIISVSTSGDLGNNYSYPGTITPDGRYILFYSDSDNLVPNDTNSEGDLFVRDLVSNTTTIVTVSTSGTQANGYSWGEFMSDDGRYVFFSSDASTLVPNDTNGQYDVFVRDLLLNTTTRLSVATNGDQGNGYSEPIDISSNGRYVLFYSDATNLVQGDTNWHSDVFIRDTVSNTTTAVTVDSSGIMGNNGGNAQYYTSISSSGNYVWFYSDSNNLVPNDTNGQYDIFINEWQVILGAAPSIVEPVNGSYRNSTGDIGVEGMGISGSDIRVTFMGNEFTTVVDANNEWSVVLPWQLDGVYTVYAQQKGIGEGVWSVTGSSTFTIDTVKPGVPVIVTPIENTMISGGSMYVVGQGEVGGTVVVKVGKQVKEGSIDGLGNWNVGPFTIVPGYKYGIVAKQRDMANNESEWTLPRTVYGVQGGVTGVNINNYLSDLILYKKGVTSTNSETTVNPNEDVTYTLDYLNGGKGYSTGVIIVEDVPENTCFTVGSISGLNNDYVVEYSNTDGVNYGYTPLGSTGAQDCAITHFRVKMLVPYEAKSNVVNDGLGGVTNNILGNSVNGLRIISSFITGYALDTGYQSLGNAVDDIDNNGYKDIVFAVSTGTDMPIYYNFGNGNFVYGLLTGSKGPASDVDIADMNNDGLLDIVGGYTTWGGNVDTLKIFINNGDGSFSSMIVTGSMNNIGNIQVYDIDNNGYKDIATFNNQFGNIPNGVATTSGGLVRYNTNLTFTQFVIPNASTNAMSFELHDFDNDTTNEMLIRNNGGMPTLYDINSGLSYMYAITGVVGHAWSINEIRKGGTVDDVDGDGRLDIIGRSLYDPFQVAFNTTTGWVVQTFPIAAYSTSTYPLVYDLDSNGYKDLILERDYFYGYYQIYRQFSTGWSSLDTTNWNGVYSSWGFIMPDRVNIDGTSGQSMVTLERYSQANIRYLRYPISDPIYAINFLAGGGSDVYPNDIGWGDEQDSFYVISWGGAYHENINIPRRYHTIMRRIDYTTGYYQTILYSTGNISGWDKLLIQDDIISGDNKIEYSVYGTLSGNICNTGSILVGPQPSYNNEIDISSISGENSSICVRAEFSIMSGNASPVLRSMLGVWDNEEMDSFTFDVKVKGGHYSGTVVTNTAYIAGTSVESNTGNNRDIHVLSGLPNFIAGGGGYGGGLEEGVKSGGSNGGGEKKEDKKIEKVESPQEKAEKIKEIDLKKPEKPVVEIPKKGEEVKSVEIVATTPNIAIKEAIVKTSYVEVGSMVEVKTVENPVLKSEKRCYSPKEVVEITLGKEKTNKDLLVYQALLKSYDLTIFSDTDSYKPQNGLKRYEAAKMFTNFAKHILCREKTNEYKSNYVDIEGIDETLKPYIIEAYEYGILRGSNDRFRPLDRISRKEFVAALMRMFVNQNLDVYNVGNEWDKEYVELFEYYGLESIVGEEEEIDRYEMSKIMYKLYYNTSYEWTEKGYVLPLKKK